MVVVFLIGSVAVGFLTFGIAGMIGVGVSKLWRFLGMFLTGSVIGLTVGSLFATWNFHPTWAARDAADVSVKDEMRRYVVAIIVCTAGGAIVGAGIHAWATGHLTIGFW